MQVLAVPFATARLAEQRALKELDVTVHMPQQSDAEDLLSGVHSGRYFSLDSVMVQGVAVI